MPVPRDAAAIGFRIRTGRAIAVVLERGGPVPRVLLKREILTHDAGDPGSGQPYHVALEEPPARAAAIVKRLTAVCARVAGSSVARLLADAREAGVTPRRAGLVIGSDVDPESIANAHMRAHAAEGQLHRRLVEEALARHGLHHAALVEKRAFAEASQVLGLDEAALGAALAAMGKHAGRPWRAWEKMAALAAWVALGRA